MIERQGPEGATKKIASANMAKKALEKKTVLKSLETDKIPKDKIIFM